MAGIRRINQSPGPLLSKEDEIEAASRRLHGLLIEYLDENGEYNGDANVAYALVRPVLEVFVELEPGPLPED